MGRERVSLSSKKKKKDNNLFYRYGITLQEFYEKYKLQKGMCDCCGKKIPKSGRYKFAVDHNHISSQVRGILCYNCNTKTVAILENKEKATMVLNYLYKWEPEYVKELFTEFL